MVRLFSPRRVKCLQCVVGVFPHGPGRGDPVASIVFAGIERRIRSLQHPLRGLGVISRHAVKPADANGFLGHAIWRGSPSS
jgi:hypothetical protein